MSPLKEIDLHLLRRERTALWISGNQPTQTTFNLQEEEILLHLKALYLLTDRIVAAGSFYFESPATRQVTEKLRYLFERGEIVFFVDELMEDFVEHGTTKTITAPTSTSYIDKSVVKKHGQELNSIGHVLKRPSQSISDRIVDLWIQEIASTRRHSLGGFLRNCITGANHLDDVTMQLVGIAQHRGEENFVWEYLKPKLSKLGLPVVFLRKCKQKLSQMYAIATAEILGLPVDRNDLAALSPLIRPDSMFDSSVFLRCMEVLRLKEILKLLDPQQLWKLKNSIEFQTFREFYFVLLETIGVENIELPEWLNKYRGASRRFAQRPVSVEAFVSTFELLCSALRKPKGEYKRPLEVLLRTYETTQQLTIDEFVTMLMKTTLESGVDIGDDLRHELAGTIKGNPWLLGPESLVWTPNGPLRLPSPRSTAEFFDVIEAIVEQFARFVEENGGWRLLWKDSIRGEEKGEEEAQLLFYGLALSCCKVNNISMDPETNFGRGPVDFKFSNGYMHRAHLEVKKVQNTSFWHGLTKQLPSYMKSDEVQDGWLLAIRYRDDVQANRRVAALSAQVSKAAAETGLNLRARVVDARPKRSASRI